MPGYSDFKFALDLLFNNEYKRCVLYAQSQFETANFQSRICVNYNNYFGMRGAVMDNCQNGVVIQGTDNTYPDVQSARAALGSNVSTYAIYDNVYRSVYDYYLYLTVRTHTPLILLNNVPQANFDPQSKVYSDYNATYVAGLSVAHYFTAPVGTYSVGVYDYAYRYGSSRGRYYINLGLSIILYGYCAYKLFSARVRKYIVSRVFNRKRSN